MILSPTNNGDDIGMIHFQLICNIFVELIWIDDFNMLHSAADVEMQELHKKQAEYKKEPAKHPNYSREWTEFWKREQKKLTESKTQYEQFRYCHFAWPDVYLYIRCTFTCHSRWIKWRSSKRGGFDTEMVRVLDEATNARANQVGGTEDIG